MMLAKLDTWFTVLIILIWVASALLEFFRKKKLKEARQKQAQKPVRDEIASVEQAEEWKDNQRREAELRRQEVLEEAEQAARQQPYRPVPLGRDLEISLEDLLRESLPQPQDGPEYLEEASPISMEFVGSEIEEAPPEIIVSLEDREPDAEPRIEKLFPGGWRSAIIASEVLSPPVSCRKQRGSF